ncbi:MAG: lytic transglycosylase domain-containing protein, partial [Bdellovibrionaceae bacterium]|nr:lytic transglycosylase domain-containing protein [Pseudobdellovibrionaceae bacterium]
MFFSFLLSISCASPSRQPTAVQNPGAPLELAEALQMGAVPAVARLRSQLTALSFEGLDSRDPAMVLPAGLRAEKPAKISKEKNQQSQFIRKFKTWKFAKKLRRAQELTVDFGCESAMETQALAFTFEIDFPENDAISWSQVLHEKVLTCQSYNPQESLFKLAIFAIQKNECPRAIEYLNKFPAIPERGINDRVAYVRSLCAGPNTVDNRNPWGGYGILLTDTNPETRKSPIWTLSVFSGSADWDRLLASFIELHEKNQQATIHYLATKINYEKFRALPVSFQTAMLTVMSFSGADLPVFQTLHKYLSEHPEMIAPSVAGLLFPTRYWEKIVQYSAHADPLLVKALIRQESAFNPLARSRARAA